MIPGKALRLRRIFAQGRALIADSLLLRADPVGWVRLLARSGADAVTLAPGWLELVAEELGGLAVIMRIDSERLPSEALVGVQAALEMGAEAVAVRVDASSAAVERFGRVAEQARRLGMPVMAEVAEPDGFETLQLSAEYGADIIRVPAGLDAAAWRNWVRATGKPLLAGLHLPDAATGVLLESVWSLMQGPAHGVVLSGEGLSPAEAAPLLAGLHALVHQDVSLDEARAAAGLPPQEA